MPDELPAPIGPDIDKIIARLYPPVVQDLVETSESLMHKKVARIQLAVWSLLEARLHRDLGTNRRGESIVSTEPLSVVFRKLLRWAGMIKVQEREMIAAQVEEHRQRTWNILEWWDANASDHPSS